MAVSFRPPFWVSPALLSALRLVGAKQVRFHKDGSWYHPLSRFPGALCDPQGYVLFKTAEAFRACAGLVITKDVNTPAGRTIASLGGYISIPAKP